MWQPLALGGRESGMLASSSLHYEARRCMSFCRCREPPIAGTATSSKLEKMAYEEMIKEKQPLPLNQKEQKPKTPTQKTLALHGRTDTAHLKQLIGFVLFF